jgi:ribosomal protein S18 acetylase RimI-like enzyme
MQKALNMTDEGKSIRIRSAKITDITSILGMLAALAEFENALHPPRLDRESVERDVLGPDPRLFIAIADVVDNQRPRAAGFISWFENYSSWQGSAGIHIGDLWTCPEYRRMGVASKLVNHVLSQCQRKRVDLFVLHVNEVARAFYERHGFQSRAEWCLYRMEANERNASE